MFKKVFNWSFILGVISMFMIVGSYMMNYHSINAYGINLKIVGTIGIIGVVIAFPILLISTFYHFFLKGTDPQKIKMVEKILFWKVFGGGSLISGIILISLSFFPEVIDFININIRHEIIMTVGLILTVVSLIFLRFWDPIITEDNLYQGEEIYIISLFKTVEKEWETIYWYEILNEEGKIRIFKCEDPDLEPGKSYQRGIQMFPVNKEKK